MGGPQRGRDAGGPGRRGVCGRAVLGPRRGAPAAVRPMAGRPGIPLGAAARARPGGYAGRSAGRPVRLRRRPTRPGRGVRLAGRRLRLPAPGRLHPRMGTKRRPPGRPGSLGPGRRRRPARAARRDRPPVGADGPVRVGGGRAVPRAGARRAAASTGRWPNGSSPQAAGPRPSDARRRRRAHPRERDAAVLRHAPAAATSTCATRPRSAPCSLPSASTCPTPGPGVLERLPRRASPLVDALLRWRKARTDRDDLRLPVARRARGARRAAARRAGRPATAAAGRMTAQHGLHNLPGRAAPGRRGRAGPRVRPGRPRPGRASGACRRVRRPAFAAATRADDLYAPVAARLGAARPDRQGRGARGDVRPALGIGRAGPGRPRARLPGRHGAARPGLRRGSARRPAAAHLRRAAHPACGADGDGAPTPAARGRFARNAVIQGSAAELFKAWAATVRHAVAPLGGRIVLCLHDELLVHAPEAHADETAAGVRRRYDESARRWAGTDAVRFVADVSVVRTWDEAKG